MMLESRFLKEIGFLISARLIHRQNILIPFHFKIDPDGEQGWLGEQENFDVYQEFREMVSPVSQTWERAN